MSTTTIKRAAFAGVLAVAVAPLAMALPAQAKNGADDAPGHVSGHGSGKGGGDRVTASGSCLGGGTWKLKAKHDDGLVEWEFEVDTNRAGQAWRVGVQDGGTTVFSGTRTTTAPSGSFSVERKTADRPGTDVLTAVATRGSARCTGTVRV